MPELNQDEKPLTKREQIAIWCLMVILKTVKPMRWEADYKQEFDKLKALISE